MGYLIALDESLIPPTPPPGPPSWVIAPFGYYAQNSSNVTRVYNTGLPTTSAKDAPGFVIVRDLTNDLADLKAHQATSHPTPIAAIYMTAAIAPDNADEGMTKSIALSNNWLMLDVNNNPISSPLASHEWVLDPAAPGLGDPTNNFSWPSRVLARLSVLNTPTPFLNAVWIDQVNPDLRPITIASSPTPNAFIGYKNNGGVRGAQYSDVETYAIAYRNFFRTAVAALQQAGYYVIMSAGAGLRSSPGTAGGWNTVNDNDGSATAHWWPYLYYDAAGPWRAGQPIPDAIMIENWILIPGFPQRRVGNANFYDNWEPITNLQLTCQAMTITDASGTRPVDFHGESYQDSTDSTAEADKQRYSYCTFLLNWNGYAGKSVHEFYSPINAYRSDYGTDIFIGQPLASKYEIETATSPNANSNNAIAGTKVFRRDFESGKSIFVNPTYTDRTYTSGKFVGTLASGTAQIV